MSYAEGNVRLTPLSSYISRDRRSLGRAKAADVMGTLEITFIHTETRFKDRSSADSGIDDEWLRSARVNSSVRQLRCYDPTPSHEGRR
jgi:hypothetical protein